MALSGMGVTNTSGISGRKKGERGSRELKRLQCSVNYDGRKEKRKVGSVVSLNLN